MKKLTIAAAVAVALAGGLAGCHRNDNGTSGTASSSSTPSTSSSDTGSTSTAASTPGSNSPNGTGTSASPTGATNGQDLAAGNTAGTNGNPTNLPGHMTGATSPGDYGNGSSNSSSTMAALGAGPANATGQAVFTQTCAACHAAGIAGAPKVGDKADWGPRIAQGKTVLYTHALQGFTGKKGTMPPKGGNTSLSDADVKAAVDYMVAQAQK